MAIITKEFDLKNMPKLSQEALDRIENIKDEDIDFSDISELKDEFFDTAKKANDFEQAKTKVTIKIDTDILKWLQSGDKDYQRKVNTILKEAMQTHKE